MRASVRNALLKSLKDNEIPGFDKPFIIGMREPKPQVYSKVTVLDLLNVGVVMNSAFPEVYDELDLTGVERKILYYVYKNVLRIYTTLAGYPRDKAGNPRFWRGKERMAADCKVSTTSFREGVRHLAEMGLVTSMDPSDEYDYAEYSITLDVKFITLDELSSNCSKKYMQLARYLYGENSVALLKWNHQGADPFQRFVDEETHEHVRTEVCGWMRVWAPRRKPIHGIRQSVIRHAIIGKRIPVIPQPTMVEVAQQERKKYEWVLTPEEREILEIKQYYEYKCRNSLNTTGFCILSTKRENWRENKKWRWLTRLHRQCKEHGWDYKVFIDAQFDRLQYFRNPQKYVFLNQFFSDGAIKYYHKYVQNYKECNSVDGRIKVKTSKVRSFIQDVALAVVIDCERINYFIKSAAKRPAYQGMSREELKIMYFSQHWTSLSKYYLADLPWFLPWLRTIPQDPTVKELGDSIAELQKSPSTMKKIHKVVVEAERQMGVPKTLALTVGTK